MYNISFRINKFEKHNFLILLFLISRKVQEERHLKLQCLRFLDDVKASNNHDVFKILKPIKNNIETPETVKT